MKQKDVLVMSILGAAILMILIFYASKPLVKNVKIELENDIIDLAQKTIKNVQILDKNTKNLDKKMQDELQALAQNLSQKIDSVATATISYTDLRVNPLEKRVDAVEKSVEVNTREIADLKKELQETQRVLHAHGRKTNDLVEMVFKAAYGDKWSSEGKRVFDQYVVCGNQELWDKVLAKLSPEQIAQVKKVACLEQKVACLEQATKKRR